MDILKHPLFIGLLTCCIGIVASIIGSYFIFISNSIKREQKNCKASCNRELDDIKKWQERQDQNIEEIRHEIIDLYKKK